MARFLMAFGSCIRSVSYDPDRNVTVTCGATEAMVATMLAVINPGDEVIIFEPFYENYGPDVILAGATARYVALREPDFAIDRGELEAAFGPRTKAIVINTPHNPSGKVFDRAELELIAELCRRHDTLGITDEIYEHIIFDGARHLSIGSLPGMAERTVNHQRAFQDLFDNRLAAGLCDRLRAADRGDSQGARFSDGWRAASAAGGGGGGARDAGSFYAELKAMYERKRTVLLGALKGVGLRCWIPAGRVLHHGRHRRAWL